MKRLTLSTLAALFVSAFTSVAHAYPSAVVFSPNGETKQIGSVGLLAYTSTNLSQHTVTPGASWFGVQAGLLPSFGAPGTVAFGGLEAGFDVITPFGIAGVKPVFNAKLGVLTEGKFTPSVALGVMELTPTMPALDYTYLSATKTFGPFGRLTLGFGVNAGDKSTFVGTFPFQSGAREALMAAYETPLILNRIGFVVDYFGGSSEVSDTYAGATLSLSSNTTSAAGAYFDNDRSVYATTYDGFFAYLTKNFDATKLFSQP